MPFYPFLGEGSPTKIDYRKSWYPYANLSTPLEHLEFEKLNHAQAPGPVHCLRCLAVSARIFRSSGRRRRRRHAALRGAIARQDRDAVSCAEVDPALQFPSICLRVFFCFVLFYLFIFSCCVTTGHILYFPGGFSKLQFLKALDMLKMYTWTLWVPLMKAWDIAQKL